MMRSVTLHMLWPLSVCQGNCMPFLYCVPSPLHGLASAFRSCKTCRLQRNWSLLVPALCYMRYNRAMSCVILTRWSWSWKAIVQRNGHPQEWHILASCTCCVERYRCMCTDASKSGLRKYTLYALQGAPLLFMLYIVSVRTGYRPLCSCNATYRVSLHAVLADAHRQPAVGEGGAS